MAFDALRSTLRRAPTPADMDELGDIASDPTVDGGIDAVAFGCPSCGRTIARGAGRCDGCGQLLLFDVPARRALSLAGGGVVAGILVTTLLVNVFAPAAPSVVANDPAGAVTAIRGTGTTGSATIPTGAAAALRGTTAINGRLAADAEPLAAASTAKSVKPTEIVKILRRMSIDARAGAGMLKPLAAWPEAAGQQAALAAFYVDLTGQIDKGLGASMKSGDAYRRTAKSILATLAQIAALDADARTLAGQAGLDLVPITIPDAIR
ncbi:MAG: hypothetical protein ABIR11_12890 [Candidatus Limnocylindrales bacterium]